MKKSLLAVTLFFAILCSSTSSLRAQMSGTVTIDSLSAASSTNFKNWYSFWRSLQGLSRTDGGSTLSAGISASVTVDVKSSLYNDSTVKFPAILGMGSTKTITIKGNGKFLVFGGLNEAISFQGGDYFTIQNLVVRHRGTNAAAAACFRFYNNSDYNTIEGCTLEFSGLTTGNTNGSAYIAFSASASNFNSPTTITTGSYNTISNNLCRTINTGNPGPSYGFTIMGSTSGYTTTAQNNTFSGNTIQNFYYCAIQNQYTNGNQFLGNNISRTNSTANNCNTTLVGFISFHSYSTSRSTTFRTNYIHDLPYVSCPASAGINTWFGMYGTNNIGSSTYPLLIDSNTIRSIAISDFATNGFFRDNKQVKIIRNTSDNIQTYNNITSMALWEVRTTEDFSFTGNRLTKSYLAAWQSAFFRGDSLWAPNNSIVDITGNLAIGNSFFADAFVFFANEGEFKIHNNQVQDNTVTGNSGGYLFAITAQEFEDLYITNNLISNNLGHDGFVGIYSSSFISGNYTCKILQNTVHSDGTKAPGGKGYDNNSSIISPYFHTAVYFSGNIFYIVEANSGVIAGVDVNDTTTIELWDNNTYYSSNIGTEIWFVQATTGYSYSDFKTYGISGKGDNFMNPKFADISTGDYRSLKWQTQNNVGTDADNPKDIVGTNRAKPKSDRGVYEQFSDLKASKTSFTVKSNECSGALLSGMDITVKNLFSDTAYNFNVSYSVNGGAKVSQKVTSKILPNDSLKISFFQPLKLNTWGNARIAIFIDAADDNASNDSFIFNTFVNPSPGGSKFTASAKPTKTIYKGGNPYDITFPGQPWIYSFTAPRGMLNSNYGSAWSATVSATTLKGTVVSGSSITIPSGGNDAEVRFQTSDLKLQDSIIRICVKVMDLNGSCDTSYCFSVFVNSIVIPDFNYSSLICGNDTAYFTNLSYVKSGGMNFHWNFGTGKAADTSNAIDPWFIYSTPGTYKVKLTAYTNPHGFATYDSATITVKSSPNSSFNRVNACEGELVKFTNSSTPATSVTYKWTFGDGQTSTAKEPTHDYAAPGQYTVKLYVSAGGCVDSSSLKAFEFPEPKANFSAAGNQCSNLPLPFTNTTSISSGIFASYWDFGSGSIINVTNPQHVFGSGGTYSVKLVTVSDFGCKDSITKSVSLKSAPLVAFSNTQLCSGDSTKFTNLTPVISGATASYFWDFGDGTKTAAQNPWHAWKSIGPKSIKFRVSLDNGCKDSITKNLEVKVQPKAAFISNAPVCSGKPVIFDNNTTWAQGTISYKWEFGDGSNSIQSDPTNTYSPLTTTNYNVQLCAMIDSACASCITKTIVVNEIPKTCDFEAIPDYNFGYFGIRCVPKNAVTGDTSPQAGVTYKWNFQNSGNITADYGQYNFQSDGTYNITMCAEFSSTTCNCCVTKQVVINRASVYTPGSSEPRIYPNPNNGKFRIELGNGASGITHVQMYSNTGKLVWETSSSASFLDVNTSGITNGVYVLRTSNSGNTYRTLVEIMD